IVSCRAWFFSRAARESMVFWSSWDIAGAFNTKRIANITDVLMCEGLWHHRVKLHFFAIQLRLYPPIVMQLSNWVRAVANSGAGLCWVYFFLYLCPIII